MSHRNPAFDTDLPAEASALSVQPRVEPPNPTNLRFKPVKKRRRRSLQEYAELLQQGDRAALSQAITLVESDLPSDAELAMDIVETCLPMSGRSIRVGITGVPGVGKSTFIESLGVHIASSGRRVAVLAVDPSSQVTGGSILGDKSRMTHLSNHPGAFVRPSPTRGSLGGVTRKTREAIILCEAAGYDTVFVETVGVGQSETAVHSMVDCFMLLMLAGAGDELQGIKRGIMEMAHVLAITKVDGDNVKQARLAQADYLSAMRLFPPTKTGWRPPVLLCSAQTGEGIDQVWQAVNDFIQNSKNVGYFERKRSDQALLWMRDAIHHGLMEGFAARPELRALQSELEQEVLRGTASPQTSARKLLEAYRAAISEGAYAEKA